MSDDRSIALLTDNTILSKAWSAKLGSANFKVKHASNHVDALRLLDSFECAAIVVSESIPSGDVIELIRTILRTRENIPIVFVAMNSSEELAIRAFRAGVSDYVRNPLDLVEIVASVTRLASRSSRGLRVLSNAGSDRVGENVADRILIGESAAIQEIKVRLLRAAAAPASSVLITGETGTGKELAAQIIHNASARKHKSLVSLNCAAIPETLLESELFGFEKGAFTGAQCSNAGVLEMADGGTLFLDEVGELSLLAQAKILRVIETKQFSRLGSRQTHTTNVRIVAATNQELELLTKQGRFRADLTFRLNVVHIHLPPLRERKEDLPALIAQYVQRFNTQFGRQVQGLSLQSYERLLCYDWPGNVRELKNLLEASFVEAEPHSEFLDLPPQCSLALAASRPTAEKEHLLSALIATKWNKSEAARQLRWSRMTLYRKMTKHCILEKPPKPGFRAA
jgi:DNA-binding NtrC family response regulator